MRDCIICGGSGIEHGTGAVCTECRAGAIVDTRLAAAVAAEREACAQLVEAARDHLRMAAPALDLIAAKIRERGKA